MVSVIGHCKRRGSRLTVSTGEVLVGGESDDHVGVLEDAAAGAVAASRLVVGRWEDVS